MRKHVKVVGTSLQEEHQMFYIYFGPDKIPNSVLSTHIEELNRKMYGGLVTKQDFPLTKYTVFA